MACPALGLEVLQPLQPEPPPEPAFAEAQKWIEQVTGRSFGDKDFRTGLENGILLCELLNAIKPGLVKKINRLPTPIAGLDNTILFLRGCKELGLKESQLFDPSDLQDTSNRVTVKNLDYSRKLKNVLVTIYWLGKAANSCASYGGTTLNLKEFEGLLAQMRKETDDIDSPKRSIRDSGYIDCWDSERSDSLSPPRHGRDDSFDSLDSFGSRSRQTPSPDVVLRGSSDGRGSDSESDLPHRKLPDVKKDDMSARRTSHGEPKSAVPFNQYLPNKSNQTAYVPAPLRKKKAEREEFRKSWSTATSPLGGERPFSQKQSSEEKEAIRDIVLRKENPFLTHQHGKDSESEDEAACLLPDLEKDDFAARRAKMNQSKPMVPLNQLLYGPYRNKDAEKAGGSKQLSKGLSDKKNLGFKRNQGQREDVNTMVACTVQTQKDEPLETNFRKTPDRHKDDLAQRRIQGRLTPHREAPSFIKLSGITEADLETWERLKVSGETRDGDAQNTCAPEPSPEIDTETAIRDDFASRKARAYKKASGPRQKFVHFGPVTEIDQQTWKRLSIGKAGPRDNVEVVRHSSQNQISSGSPPSTATFGLKEEQMLSPQSDCRTVPSGTDGRLKKAPWLAPVLESQEEQVCIQSNNPKTEEVTPTQLPQDGREQNEEVIQKEHEMLPRVQRPEECSGPLYGPRTPVSDDAESTSMFDMRCEEEAAVLPHSRARQEQLQLINNQLREEDDKWQDDLARWKSRRRSASQDLIKKEEERKKMEKLMSGEDGTSERRKSIKTYREIVQEKERRERELHEAYKNARSQEEAEGILQQYIERFTISEAVLERLEMPKILERSHSTEPNVSSFPNDPSPMKYLRQQSLPPPKFTATVETTIARTSVPESIASAGTGSPSKIITPNTVPMLTPRPYSQPKNSQEVLKTFKVDGKVSMNGEMAPGDEEGKEKEGPAAAAPGPSLTKSQMFEGVATVHDSPVQVKQGSNSIEINIKKPNSAPQELTAASEETESNGQEDEDGEERPGTGDLEPDSAEPQHFTTTVTRCSPTVALVEFSSNPQLKNEVPEQGQKKPEDEMSGKVELVLSQKVAKPKSPEPEATLTFPFLDKMPETNQLHLPNPSSQADSPSSEKSPGSTPFKFWAWDPEEERRRQEKWQQEQERLLQERYQKEQDKLKEEWEKAQKEVEEEERRYYEEERKIIEDTVVPFTISSSSADQLSTSLSVTEGSGTRNKMDLENCPDKENERRQKTPFQENDGDSLLKTREGGLPEEQSLTPSPSANPEISVSKGIHQDPQLEAEAGAPHCGTNPQPAQDPPRNQQIPNPPTSTSEDVKPKTLALEKTINHQMESPGERRKSISGKKLCSSCGLTLGKGAAMIIETLNLYFHIQCFRCGICKGQLGDAVSGTDVRIRNGLLNCTDCYMRSRSAGQPTTL
ncbi:LIM and calponin homology domains-containing protein 1 isoform 13 [Mus musculus]|uniref:LIM and calponin homology domains-containing protein 1 isoform 13 n=1 Tax=Mus musculus TaxID=10090 RepID=UPI001EE046AC|nr:LIM and calponin homology domains-containing protein 1 isoform 13 [Mus musculus]